MMRHKDVSSFIYSARKFFSTLVSYLTAPFKRQTKLIQLGKLNIAEHHTVHALQLKYNSALKEQVRIQEITKKVMEEILLKGDKPHLAKLLESLQKDEVTTERKAKRLQKELEKREKILDGISYEYDRRMNNYGKFWSFMNIIFIGFLLYEVSAIRNMIFILNPSLGITIDTFAINVDNDFYNVSAQLIIALAVALFIGKTRKSSTTPWYDLSRFATGVCWVLAGIATCLYVLAGDTPGIYTLSIVIVSEIILLYTALKPLAFSRNTP